MLSSFILEIMMETSSEKTLLLQIDERGMGTGIAEALAGAPEVFRCETTRLKTGHYLIERRIVIERIGLPDFLSALKSGDLFQDAYRLAYCGYRPVMILEGDKSEVANLRLKRESVQGALVHLMVILGIPLLRSANSQETCRLIRYIGIQLARKTTPRKQRPIQKAGATAPTRQDGAIGLLAHLPGIGPERAQAMLDRFGSLREVFNADVETLQDVKGIGRKRAEVLVRMMNGK
jgi:ERCC4-type nuclease